MARTLKYSRYLNDARKVAALPAKNCAAMAQDPRMLRSKSSRIGAIPHEDGCDALA